MRQTNLLSKESCKKFLHLIPGAFLGLLLSACFGPLSGPGALNSPNEQIAILENRWGCPFCVDAIYLDSPDKAIYIYDENERIENWSSFRLMPGRYVIAYSHYAHRRLIARADAVDLKPGHIYRVDLNLCLLPCWGHSHHTIWIEDRTTGEVVAGEKW